MMGAEDGVDRFVTLVERRLGLMTVAERRGELVALLEERAPRQEWGAYLGRLELAGPGDAELRLLAERLTVGETYFFRHQTQLEVLVEQVLPASQRGGRPCRVLSAGCSTGEEAYSVAILGQESPRVDTGLLFITGVDVNPRAIERARWARYSPWALRATSEALRARWFRVRPEGEFELLPKVREQVIFEERNILDEDPSFWSPGAFDVILCRNVSIYFSAATTRQLIERLTRALVPGGYLFLGPSETLRGVSDAFELVQAGDVFFYRRRGPSAPVTGHLARPLELPDAPASWAVAPVLEGGLAEAWRLFEGELYAESLAALEALPEAEQQALTARLLLAVLHLQGGEFAQAERLGEALLEASIAAAAAHYLLGLCREQAGDRAGARGHYERAVHLEPTFAQGHLRLGVLARRAGEVVTARQALRLARTLLAQEKPLYLVLFGGGFSRHGLMQVCQQELRACEELV